MKKKFAVTLALIMCFLGGCSHSQSSETLSDSNSDIQSIVEEAADVDSKMTETSETSEETSLSGIKDNLEPPDLQKIHVSEASLYCPWEEYPDLYEDAKALLSQRQRILNTILGIDYDKQLNMDESITDEDGRIFYRFKEECSLEDVRADLATVYTDDYIDTDGAWYLTYLFHEDHGKLYRTSGDGWADGLYDNWVLWQINDTDYYIQGYRAIGAFDYGEWPVLSILRITQTDEGLRICSEQYISFLQNIYVIPEEEY